MGCRIRAVSYYTIFLEKSEEASAPWICAIEIQQWWTLCTILVVKSCGKFIIVYWLFASMFFWLFLGNALTNLLTCSPNGITALGHPLKIDIVCRGSCCFFRWWKHVITFLKNCWTTRVHNVDHRFIRFRSTLFANYTWHLNWNLCELLEMNKFN